MLPPGLRRSLRLTSFITGVGRFLYSYLSLDPHPSGVVAYPLSDECPRGFVMRCGGVNGHEKTALAPVWGGVRAEGAPQARRRLMSNSATTAGAYCMVSAARRMRSARSQRAPRSFCRSSGVKSVGLLLPSTPSSL